VLALRYFLLLSIFPACFLLGMAYDWRFGLGLTIAVVLLLAWQARRLGTSFRGVMANFGRAYRSMPRVIWSADHRAAQRAGGPDTEPVITRLDGTHFYSDLPPLEARELQVVVRETRQGLAELFPGSEPVDRVLLFSRQPDMLAYLGGWFGTVGSKAAGFCFAMGAVRVVGAVDAFRELGRDPKALLAHELVHGGVRGAARGMAMHPWLNEGLAEALAVSWFEPARVPGLHRFLRRARAAGHWMEWDELREVRPGHVVAWLRSGDRAQLMKAQLLYSQSCLLVLALLDREGPEHPCLRAMMKKPREAQDIMRQHLGFDGGELLGWVAREVDAAPVDLTPWDRSRRAVLRALLAQDPPSRFRASAVLGLAACGDAEELPLLEALAAAEDQDLAAQARLALDLLRSVP
jgi:hypothetical protein